MEATRNELIRRIESEWPMSLEDWDMREARYASFTSSRTLFEPGHHLSTPEPASAIAFARRFDIPSILPAAFYDLFGLALENNWESRDEGGDEMIGRPVKWDHLSAKDFFVLMRGRERLRNRYEYLMCTIEPYVRTSECEGCGGECSSRYADVCRVGQDPETPLASLNTMMDSTPPADNSPGCRISRSWFLSNLRATRKSLWDGLPRIFDMSCVPLPVM